jgi:hypothetical protein
MRMHDATVDTVQLDIYIYHPLCACMITFQLRHYETTVAASPMKVSTSSTWA